MSGLADLSAKTEAGGGVKLNKHYLLNFSPSTPSSPPQAGGEKLVEIKNAITRMAFNN